MARSMEELASSGSEGLWYEWRQPDVIGAGAYLERSFWQGDVAWEAEAALLDTQLHVC